MPSFRFARALLVLTLLGVSLGAQAPPKAAPDTRLAEASRALSAGDVPRAIALCTAYAKQHPSDARAYVLMARVALTQDDIDGAYVALRRALQADPRSADALYYLGSVSARLADREFGRLESIAPDSARMHQLRAESLEAQDKRAAAEKEYDAALAVKPDLLDALLASAKLKRIRLACEDAVPQYEKAESIRPTFEGAYGLGVCRSYLQDDETAIKWFERAIQRDARAAVAWAGLGESLVKLRRETEAIPKLQRAIALEPAMGEAYYALGRAYQAAGDKIRAQEAFHKAESLGGAVGASGPAAEAPPGAEPH
jgi:tetratricopeptide (TPR) repeat protein